jgi:hypothetical protein
LTEPTVGELQSKLKSLGYQGGLVAWLIGYSRPIFFIVVGIVIAVLITVLRSLGVF